MKIAFFSTKRYDEYYFNRNNDGQHEFFFYDTRLNEDTVDLARKTSAICVFVNDIVNEPVIKKLSEQDIRLILLRCAGFNNVDLKAAQKYDMKVFRVPAYSPSAVAEHAVALILTLNRKTHKAYNRVRELNFSLERLTGFTLKNKTIGVIGTGKIGSSFCEIMLGFGCHILAYDKYKNKDLKKSGVEYTGMENCLQQADIISLHCPLNDETKNMINAERIKKMKDGVMLINTSRGGLVNTRDVIEGLKHKKIGYLGIDVYEQEENLFFEDYSETIIQDDMIARLLTFPNVLITSHQGFLTEEAMDQIAKTTLNNVRSYNEGKETENLVAVDA